MLQVNINFHISIRFVGNLRVYSLESRNWNKCLKSGSVFYYLEKISFPFLKSFFLNVS